MQIMSNTGNPELAKAFVRSAKPNVSRTSKAMQQQQQSPRVNQIHGQSGQLQAVITPQGLQHRKTVSVQTPQQIQGRLQLGLPKGNQVSSTVAGQTRQMPLLAGTSANQTQQTQQIVLSPQQQEQLLQRQLLQGGQKLQNTKSDTRIMEILAQANVQHEQQVNKTTNIPSEAPTVASNVQIQPMQGTSQTASSQVTNVLKNIISSPGSLSDIKNASPTKLQIIYKPDGKELTKEQLESLTNQLAGQSVRPGSQSVQLQIRQKMLQQQQGASPQVMQVTQPGQQQSVVIQGQQGIATQRQILIQQGSNVAVQQQQVSQPSRTTQLAQQQYTSVNQQAKAVPQRKTIQQARTQEWVGYQQQQQLQAQQRMQATQPQRLNQQQQQQVQLQQQQLVQNQHQIQLQNQQGQQQRNVHVQGTLENPTALQSLNSQGQQVLHISQTGQQILLRQQSPQTANVLRNVNQTVQSSSQIQYNRDGQPVSQLVRVVPQNSQGQQSKVYELAHGQFTSQTGQGVQNGPVLKYVGSTSQNAMTTEQYQQNVQAQTVFTATGQKQRRLPATAGFQQQQQQTVLTSGSHATVSPQVHLQASYPQSTSTVTDTQSNNGITFSYQTARPGLAQLKAAYGQGSPQPQQQIQQQYVQVAQSSGQVQGVVPTMASTVVRQIKDAVATSAGRPQLGHHTVLATPDDDSPPVTPARPGQGQLQVVQPQQSPQPQQAVVTLLTGEDVTHNLKSLPAGTPVQVKRSDNVGLEAIWNGTSITLKNQMQGIMFPPVTRFGSVTEYLPQT